MLTALLLLPWGERLATQTTAIARHGGFPETIAGWAHDAMLFDGLGDRHRPITTSSPEAQKYFDQGFRFLWAFNHDEATRSFARATQLDPQCAACWWGVSLSVGPNYNLPFLAEPRAKLAYDARRHAENNASHVSAVERALIGALTRRYPGDRALDPVSALPVHADHAAAMREVAAAFPRDLDVQTLYAESMMNVRAWKLWTADGRPAPDTEEIIATLESVLAHDPQHTGANHYLVHAVEASPLCSAETKMRRNFGNHAASRTRWYSWCSPPRIGFAIARPPVGRRWPVHSGRICVGKGSGIPGPKPACGRARL